MVRRPVPVFLRKWTILVHRYLGIALFPLFVVWFGSAIGMLFTGGMPTLSRGERLERLSAIDFGRVTVSAEAAAHGRQVTGVILTSILGRPAYRFGARTVVFADSGESLEDRPVSPRDLAAEFLKLPAGAVGLPEVVRTRDQWTFALRRALPLQKFRIGDDEHTEIYVSEARGEVALVTTRTTRLGAWVSAIPHWFYLTWLRERDSAWRQVVLWTAGLGSISVTLGLVLAVVQFSPRRPFRVSEIGTYNPYAGSMRWHYVSGLFFGLFALTWTISGLLSMQPWDWSEDDFDATGIQAALRGGPLHLSRFSIPAAGAFLKTIPGGIKELEFVQIGGEPFFALSMSAGPAIIVSAASLQAQNPSVNVDVVARSVGVGAPGVPLLEVAQLSQHDAYYYNGRERVAPLPVIRAKLGDADQTWLYVDPARGEIRAGFGRKARLERWFYHGLHSLDFAFWYENRGLWTVGVATLLVGGLILSGAGAVLGCRRIWRGVRRARSQLS